MNNKEKSFNIKLYAVCVFVLIAVFLAIATVFTFKAKYTAFHPEKLAAAFVDSIAETGDGYNAYKNTLVSKNMKYGDFIRKSFINPVVERDIEENAKAYSDDSFKGDKTLNDDGTLKGQLQAAMYPVYEELITEYGWDNYSAIFTEYIEELIKKREEIFGDKFFNDEVFFTAFEANVSQYSDKLTGTEDIFDENTGLQLSEKTTGIYENAFGEGYSFSSEVTAEKNIDIADYKQQLDVDQLNLYGIKEDEITDVKAFTVDVFLHEGLSVAAVDVTVVKIGFSWYVDNILTDTKALYSFYG